MMNNKEFLDGIYKKYNDPKTLDDKFYRKKINNKNHVPLYLVIICVFVIAISSSIGFADNYLNFFNKSGTATVKTNEMEMAIKDNYIQNVDMKYCKSSKVGVKVDSISMDSNKLYIVFNFKFDKSLQDNFDDLIIPNMLITNDNYDLIFSNDVSLYHNFCKENNIDFNKKAIYKIDFKSNLIEKTHDTAKFIYYFNTENSFSKSKEIHIKFNNITLVNYSIKYSNNKENNLISGNWNISLNLEDSFYNSKSIIYSTNDINDNIEEVYLNLNSITSTLIFNKKNDFSIEEIYIKDKNNKKYNMQDINISDTGKVIVNLGVIKDINSDSLTLHIKTNTFEKDILLNKQD